MCKKGDCHYCNFIKQACLIWAIINVIANTLLLLFSCYIWYRLITYVTPELPKEPGTGIAGKIGGIQWRIRNKHDAIDDFMRPKWLFNVRCIYTSIVTLLSLLNIIFNLLLCNGILNRWLGWVDVYFIYGVAVIIPHVFITLTQLTTEDNLSLRIGGLCGYALHMLFLALVYQTRIMLRKEVTFIDHVRLEMVDIDIRPSAPPLDDIDE